ncbi:MgtC/SapB family protein [Kaistella daneshvariae]|jgi:putative Mg2+ transporter-C (MgtC) family protein|uniref:MgtC/SapB family protein n=1 Tax=Kaistella daneshvariae TaxID=2487074 RepID=A0A3N0WY13_9FLAO|nr:MgtC/SapB family protein [Kaistella daneshvariae]AZI67636.1 MgtC/SapB family protein [Kaistella daneshvariae]ROI09873.1 MgtC/SapB family protein [Kaistella daneshvariae]
MSEHFELLDVYKAFFALIAGLILGFEREMKDKSAGLKTITIICLGSALFSILSYKLAGTGDPTRIASYIVSGIGFLGAGVIFKEGFNVYGLTTAGVIWIAAAVGMAIGFGEINIAFTFLISALIIIYVAKLLTNRFLAHHHNKILKFKIDASRFSEKKDIIQEIDKISKVGYQIALEKKEDYLVVSMELHITTRQLEKLEIYLMENKNIESFSY